MTAMKYQQELLKMVISRYESSKSFATKTEGSMSIKLIDQKKYMSDQEYEYRLSINEAAKALERQDLIRIKWYEKNNIIERIQFDLSCMDQFYVIANVDKKIDELQQLKVELNGMMADIQTHWILDFLRFLLIEIEEKKHIPSKISDSNKRYIIFKSLIGIDGLLQTNQMMLERVFSKKYLNNSKLFEKEVRSIILGIIRKYDLSLGEDLSVDEILAEVGIEKTTTELFIKAPMSIWYKRNLLDLTNFPYGVALNTQTFKLIEVENVKIAKLISIENKANFLKACEEAEADTAIVFSSGFYNPSQRKFLSRVREVALQGNPECQFYHSGDMDLGGFNIFNHIKKMVLPELQPYNMNSEVFQVNLDYAEDIKDNEYRVKIEKLLLDINFEEFHDLIRLMVDKGKILEQECLLF